MMRKHAAVKILLILGCLASAGGLLAYYLLWTSHGSGLLTRWLISRYTRSASLAIRELEGTLAKGLTLREVQIPGLSGALQGTVLDIEGMELAPLSLWTSEPLRFEMHEVRLQPTQLAEEIRIATIEGSLADRAVLHHLSLWNLARFPPGSALDIQRLEVGFPLRLEHVTVVHNARLRLPFSEPVVVFGRQDEARADVSVYVRRLSLHDILTAFSKKPALQYVQGTVSELDASVNGSMKALALTGRFEVMKLAYKEFLLTECPTTFSLILTDLAETPTIHGDIVVSGGTVTSRHTTATIQQGRLRFAGDPSQPSFEVRGTSMIGRTKISIALTGTPEQPDLKLTSDPPVAEEILLAMLVTGKPWRGAQEALAKGVISSDLAVDFIDYFVFGGVGGKLAKRFGITSLSVTHDSQTKRLGIETTIADRVGLGVEVDPTQLPAATGATQPTSIPLSTRIGAEVQVTESTAVQLEGERTPLEPRSGSSQADSTGTTQPAPQTDDRVLLKIKKTF